MKSRAPSDRVRILVWRTWRSSLALAFLMLAPVQLQASVLYPDLTFQFDCEGQTHLVVEDFAERFLTENGFEVLNVTRIRRENKLPAMQAAVFVDGLDSQKRRMRFMAVPFTGAAYTFLLNTQPPTRRSNDLEAQVIEFVSGRLGCQIRDLERNENGAEAKELFESVLKDVQRNFSIMKNLGKT